MDPRVIKYLQDKGSLPADYDVGTGVEDAQGQVDFANAAQGIAGIGDVIANNQRKTTVLQNRMQDLGKAPTTITPQAQHTDLSGLQRNAQIGLQSAKTDRDQAIQVMLEQKKQEMANKIQADRLALEDQRWGATFKQKDDEIKAMDAYRKSQQAATQAQQSTSNDFKQQELDIQRQKAAADKKPKLSGDEQKVISYASAVNQGIKDMRDALTNGDNTFTLWGDNNFTEAARRAAENYGRLQSGGAINKDEEARFLKMLPSATDSREMQARKLQKMESEMGARMQTLGVDPSAQAALRNPNTAPKVTKVRVSNGKETFDIDPADLASAEKDGFRRMP